MAAGGRQPIAWLHLSDWHQGNRASLDRGVLREALLRDIERRATEIHPNLGRLDFIVFSGDLAFKGADDEYERASKELLEELLKVTGVGRDRIFFVPGNHDVDRSRLRYLPKLLETFREREAVSEAFQDPEHRRHLLFGFRGYREFVKKFLGEDAPAEPDYGYTKTIDTPSGLRVSVMGLNSAWMCGQCLDPYTKEVNDYGRLILGEHQYRQAMAGAPAADLRIGVMHHPFHWLSDVEQRASTERDLLEHCHFILRGHEHKAVLAVPVGTAGHCAVLSAGAAYDRRDYANGYNFVLLNLDRGQGTVFLRSYVDDRRSFGKDTATTGDSSPGLVTFTLPKALGQSPERESGPRRGSGRIVGDPWSTQSPAAMQSMAEVFARQHEQEEVHYALVRFVVKAESLANLASPDEVVTTVHLRPVDKPLYCHRVGFLSAPGSEYLGQASWRVWSLNNEVVQAIEIPILSQGDPPARQILLFFDPVLQREAGYCYGLEVRERVADSMQPLRLRGRDELYLRAGREGKTDRAELILLVPKGICKVEMRNSMRKRVTKGEKLKEEEARRAAQESLANEDLSGYEVFGWYGKDMESDGFIAAEVVQIG
ncbi:MAG: metallophosphoesterase [Bryobacteraceae bacterium]|nr:metallophosphoesterase [Bryobacteraceae bacterium]